MSNSVARGRRGTSITLDFASEPDTLITNEELAAFLHRTPQSTQALRDRGSGPSFYTRISPGCRHHIFYKIADVFEWLHESCWRGRPTWTVSGPLKGLLTLNFAIHRLRIHSGMWQREDSDVYKARIVNRICTVATNRNIPIPVYKIGYRFLLADDREMLDVFSKAIVALTLDEGDRKAIKL